MLYYLPYIAIAVMFLFEAVNGFHDTAYSCATSISSGALRYWQAVSLAGVCNGIGAAMALFLGAKVAATIVGIIHVDPAHIPLSLMVAAVVTATVWNLATWYMGMPVSSSHCLIGSLAGAAAATQGYQMLDQFALAKVLLGLLFAPVVGFFIALTVGRVLLAIISRLEKRQGVHHSLRWLQILSCGWVSVGHGANDGQKTMALITLTLSSAFGYNYHEHGVPAWVILSCAACMGLGTTIGAGRIIRRVQNDLVKEPISYETGLVTELVTGALLQWGSMLGLPLSTTQTFTGSLAGAQSGAKGGASLSIQFLKKAGTRNWFRAMPVHWGTFGMMAAIWWATLLITFVMAFLNWGLFSHLLIG